MSNESQAETAEQQAEIQRLQFLMRSGNSFVVDGVQDYEIKYRGDAIVSLRLRQAVGKGFTHLLVETVALAQIEAVLVLPPAEVSHG